MKYSLPLAFAVLLSGPSFAAAPPAPAEAAIERIVHAVMSPAKQEELLNNAADRMTDKLAEKALPPACLAELRTAFRGFMGQLLDEGILTKLMTAQFRAKLTDEELLTLANFLESSVGQKLVTKSINLHMDKEQLARELKPYLDARKAEFSLMMNRILEKHGVKAR